MNEFYHPSVFFFIPLFEFKCMQRSKAPFRRRRWCNKQKAPEYSPSSPPSMIIVLAQSVVLPQTAARGQECLGVFFFSFLFFVPPSPSSLSFMFSAVCLLRVNVRRYRHACMQAHAEPHIIVNTDLLGGCLQTVLHRKVRKDSEMTLQFLSRCETTLGVTSQGHDLLISPPAIGVPLHHAALSQLHIYQPPVCTPLLTATVINFTGRQSNK